MQHNIYVSVKLHKGMKKKRIALCAHCDCGCESWFDDFNIKFIDTNTFTYEIELIYMSMSNKYFQIANQTNTFTVYLSAKIKIRNVAIVFCQPFQI